jgi:hypothetical protein
MRTLVEVFILFMGFNTPGTFYRLLGWREKRGFLSPLSESPLGQPLVPRDDKGRELVVGQKLFYPTTPSS